MKNGIIWRMLRKKKQTRTSLTYGMYHLKFQARKELKMDFMIYPPFCFGVGI